MAYYSSTYSGSDYGEYNFNSYAVNYDYDHDQIPAFMAYKSHEYNQPYYGYDPSLYFSPNYPAQSYQTVAYSAATFSNPKSIEYDPNYGMTQLVISYSTLEFNEPAFDDYDPTPYGGGYDIAETYGKPLPPSDKICYPHSGSSSISVPFDAVPTGSLIPLPTVEEGIDEKEIIPQNGTAGQTTEEKPQSQESSIDQPNEPYEGEDSEEDHREDDQYSGSGYGSGFDNGYNGGQCEEHEKQVHPQYPSGYGLEAMDICESLFGHWPCLSRMKKRENFCEEVTDRGNNCQENMWEGTADYLFGNPYPYGRRGENGSSYGGDLVYGYERHYPIQTQYRQIDYTDES
ncbi:uncharacterized protein LOC133311726 isoform X2 [Gastrolobium bilobum]|uniref:uncharacterized protein LOC133311726 isoform X2 n=1 Tax=Gastrolobium bilobum TaxID=150636 RepID=UPI002AB26CDC|nr:uncharacterized protein LOC133311726 isoform X2 [Gastrolobium bilobum]